MPPPYRELLFQLTVVLLLNDEASEKLKFWSIVMLDVPCTSIDFTEAEALIIIVLPVGIITSLVAVGTWAGLQLLALLYRSFTAPVHVMVCACIPISDIQHKSRKNSCFFIIKRDRKSTRLNSSH